MSSSENASEEISPGLECQWLEDGRILALIIAKSDRHSVDNWFNTLDKICAEWPTGHAYLCLQDISEVDIFLTPYMRERVTELSRKYPALAGRTAVLAKSSLAGRIMGGFLQVISHNNARQRRIFFDRTLALAWLKELL